MIVVIRITAGQLNAQSFTGTTSVHVVGRTTPVDISGYFNNDGIATADAPGSGNIDGWGYSYPAEELPTGGTVTHDLVPCTWPSGEQNNIQTDGQTITLPKGRYHRLNILGTGTWGDSATTATVTYADGTTATAPVNFADWASGQGTRVISTTFRYGPNGRDNRGVNVFRFTVPIDRAKEAVSVSISRSTSGGQTQAHVFALTAEE
ncbi:hypothetical protein OIE66_27370 [Nonomuraea sp. NBC_01738]|uniref:hypothetical protein n=1 Tax=Nonomuraea sp. NBC_01738 TaxID=2976003 RepID=UPI002E11717C|nr:hypothetical protein OIE66_27370 [Nonomuraea sp. NBC_01738]